jgi:hypothetical protein
LRHGLHQSNVIIIIIINLIINIIIIVIVVVATTINIISQHEAQQAAGMADIQSCCWVGLMP